MSERGNGTNPENRIISRISPLDDFLRRVVDSDIIFFNDSPLANYVRIERNRLKQLREAREIVSDE